MCMMLISIEIENSDLAPFGMGVQLFKYSFILPEISQRNSDQEGSAS